MRRYYVWLQCFSASLGEFWIRCQYTASDEGENFQLYKEQAVDSAIRSMRFTDDTVLTNAFVVAEEFITSFPLERMPEHRRQA